jgi:hypothetical protein
LEVFDGEYLSTGAFFGLCLTRKSLIQKGLSIMFIDDRAFLRLHIEAVWGVQLPQLDHNDVSLLPGSLLPSWRLCAAEVAEGRVCIWRPDVDAAQRKELLARLDEALLLPSSDTPPPGISREVAFRLAAEPAIDFADAWRVARLLVPDDHALIEAFEPDSAAYFLQPECHPAIGVIVDGRLCSIAHSSRRTREACELGINTLSDARRKGYALAATVAWSAALLQEGLTPIYSALATNAPSLKLAGAAGYREIARAVTLE